MEAQDKTKRRDGIKRKGDMMDMDVVGWCKMHAIPSSRKSTTQAASRIECTLASPVFSTC